MIDPKEIVFSAGRPNAKGIKEGPLGGDSMSGDAFISSVIEKGNDGVALPQGVDDKREGNKLSEFVKNWPVKQQHGSRGTCTAFSFNAMCEYHATQVPEQPQEPPYSEEYLYSKMRREMSKHAPPNADTGSTYLIQAILAMRGHGLCPEELLPYQGAKDDPAWSVFDTRKHQSQLDPHILQNRRVFYWRPDLKDLRDPMPISVESFSDLMFHFAIPVCISLPIYPDGKILSWSFGVGWDTGVIPEPTEGWSDIPVDELSGHSVCLVGSIPDPDAPGKGWFIFRNSWGPEFAARMSGVDVLKEVLMPGYGAISFEHVQQHCWEVAFLLPANL